LSRKAIQVEACTVLASLPCTDCRDNVAVAAAFMPLAVRPDTSNASALNDSAVLRGARAGSQRSRTRPTGVIVQRVTRVRSFVRFVHYSLCIIHDTEWNILPANKTGNLSKSSICDRPTR